MLLYVRLFHVIMQQSLNVIMVISCWCYSNLAIPPYHHEPTSNLCPQETSGSLPVRSLPTAGQKSKKLGAIGFGESSIQIHPTFKTNNNQVYNHQDCKKYVEQKPFLLYKHPRLKSSHPFPYGQACPMLDIRPCGKRRSWDTRAAQAAVGWRPLAEFGNSHREWEVLGRWQPICNAPRTGKGWR